MKANILMNGKVGSFYHLQKFRLTLIVIQKSNCDVIHIFSSLPEYSLLQEGNSLWESSVDGNPLWESGSFVLFLCSVGVVMKH